MPGLLGKLFPGHTLQQAHRCDCITSFSDPLFSELVSKLRCASTALSPGNKLYAERWMQNRQLQRVGGERARTAAVRGLQMVLVHSWSPEILLVLVHGWNAGCLSAQLYCGISGSERMHSCSSAGGQSPSLHTAGLQYP